MAPPLASVEVYAPALGTWTGSNALTTARNNHTATPCPTAGSWWGGAKQWPPRWPLPRSTDPVLDLDGHRCLTTARYNPRLLCCPTARSWWREAIRTVVATWSAPRFTTRLPGPGRTPAPYPMPAANTRPTLLPWPGHGRRGRNAGGYLKSAELCQLRIASLPFCLCCSGVINPGAGMLTALIHGFRRVGAVLLDRWEASGSSHTRRIQMEELTLSVGPRSRQTCRPGPTGLIVRRTEPYERLFRTVKKFALD